MWLYRPFRDWLLRSLTKHGHHSLIGDLEELYEERLREKGAFNALFWLWRQSLGIPVLFIQNQIFRSLGMMCHYVRIFIRVFSRQKRYTFINVLGLSIGIGCCLWIMLFVSDELSFDKFHENGERLYRVMQIQYDNASGKESLRQPYLPAAMGPEVEKWFAEIEHQTRTMWGGSIAGVVRYGDRLFEEHVFLVDSPFFEMFTFPLIYGDPAVVLQNRNNIILTKSVAKKYFGERNPMGEVLKIAFGQTRRDYIVTGLAEDVPSNSSIRFDLVMHIDNLPIATNDPNVMSDWQRWYFPFYVQLHEGVSPMDVDAKFPQFCRQFFVGIIQHAWDEGDWTQEDLPFSFGLQPVTDMVIDGRGFKSSYILSAIALMILIIACVNFMNLSIGLSSVRSMEVGVRKVLGAERRQLIRQYWGEAFMMCLIASILGILLARLFLPSFNMLSGKSLRFSSILIDQNIWALLAIITLTGLAAGSYPALMMARFSPVDILKRKLRIGGRSSLTRGLVVFQFVLSVGLVTAAMLLGRQVNYLLTLDVGYAKEGLLVIMTQEVEKEASEALYRRFRNRAASSGRILGMTASNREFGLFLPGTTFDFNGNKIHFRFNRVDPDFITTMGMRLVQGRDFSPNPSADQDAMIVNESFLRALNQVFEPGMILGDVSRGFPYDRRVIGVIRDPHFRDVRSEMEPLMLYVGELGINRRDRFTRIMVRINTESVKEGINYLETCWRDVQPEKPFSFAFQDELLERRYEREKRWSMIVRYASILSIIIACLGIYGLTAISLSRRIKEIGIRKVLGAGASHVIRLVIREFIWLIVIANAIAWPVVFLIIRRVLQNYPYRIDIHLHDFLISSFGSIFLAVVTVLYLTVKTSFANPVDSLKYE